MGQTSKAGKAWLENVGNLPQNDIMQSYMDFMGKNTSGDADQWDAYVNNLMQMGQSELDYRRSLENQQRERDWTLQDREHEENYNDPSQVLARLMATGMSRQAAMALLNGGQSSVPNAVSAASSLGATTAPSGTAESNAVNNANAIIGALTSFSDLALQATSFGLSLPAIKSQNALSTTAAYMSQMQRDAYDMSGQFYAGIHQAVLNGSLDRSAFTSYDEMARLAYALPDSPDNHGLYNFMHGGSYARMLSNPFAMDNQHSLFNANWGTQDVASNVVDGARLRSLQAQGMLLDQQQVTATIANINADTDTLIEQLNFDKQMHPLEVEAQTLENAYTRGEMEQQWIETEQMWMDLDIAREVFDNVKDGAIYRTLGELKRWTAMSDQKVVDKEMLSYCQDLDNLYAMSYLSFLTFNASAEFYAEHSDLRTTLNVVDDLHIPELIGGAKDLVGMIKFGQGSVIQGADAQRMVRSNAAFTRGKFKRNVTPKQQRIREQAHRNGTFYDM